MQRAGSVLLFHAGLTTKRAAGTSASHPRRRDNHREATVAFGMGINKPNVRFILHQPARNLDSYYQQIGRAGRDGLPAECLLLFSTRDVQRILYFIRQQSLEEQRGARWRLDAMLAFAETNGCRRVPLLAYFGEPYEQERCDHCDNCLVEEQELDDLTIPAQKFLSCVKRTGELFGMSHIIAVLRGSKAQRVLSRRHDRLSTYGIGKEFSRQEWQYLARQFIQQGLLEQDMEVGSLRLTPGAYAVFRGEPVRGALPSRKQTTPRVPAGEPTYDRELFALLRKRRLELAEADGVPPYAIFPDRTLIEIATYFPSHCSRWNAFTASAASSWRTSAKNSWRLSGPIARRGDWSKNERSDPEPVERQSPVVQSRSSIGTKPAGQSRRLLLWSLFGRTRCCGICCRQQEMARSCALTAFESYPICRKPIRPAYWLPLPKRGRIF